MEQKLKSKRMKFANRELPSKKSDGFAIGVSPMHYWVITATASSRNMSRSAILEEILTKHLDATLAEVKA